MLKVSLLAAAAVLSFSTFAHATTIDMSVGSSSYTYGFGSPVHANMDLANIHFNETNTDLLYGHNHTHVPKGHLYQDDYIDVSGGGHATMKLSGNYNTFGFKWGTIDAFNTLLITDSRGVTFKITGTDMLNYLTSEGSKKDQSNLVFTDPYADIVKVEFKSGQDSFEAANFFEGNSSAAVPLPASSVLFAIALAGLALFGWKKQQQG